MAKYIRDYITVTLVQIDGTEDFAFEVPDYHPMNKRALEMVFYDEYMNDEFITIVVNVTERLTGTVFTSQPHLRVTFIRMTFGALF